MALTENLLFRLFDCAFGVAPALREQWRPPAKPTKEDIAEVERRLGILLPPLLVELAAHSVFFSRWFADLGPDRSSPIHILRINERLAEEGKSDDFVVLNLAFDGDCHGVMRVMRNHNQIADEAPVLVVPIDLWQREAGAPRELAPNFRNYLSDLCLVEAPRSRVRSLRREAKRILAENLEG